MTASEDRSMAKKTQRLFRALVDNGSLSFPAQSQSSSSKETLSIRMREALNRSTANDNPNAAALLKARRKILKLELGALAKKAELNPSTLRALESERISPTDVQPEIFSKVLIVLGVGFEEYLDVHGSSVRSRKQRSYQSAALKRPHERRGSRTPAAISGADWLARLAEALKRPTIT